VVATAATLGVPTPAFSTALAFYDGYRYLFIIYSGVVWR